MAPGVALSPGQSTQKASMLDVFRSAVTVVCRVHGWGGGEVKHRNVCQVLPRLDQVGYE